MAERRMFAKTIIDSDAFIDMPVTSRLLYYDLAMRADDDGFVNSPKKIMRMIGASETDLSVLVQKKFIIPFENGIVVIKHWRIHNYIRNDRYKETKYLDEKAQLYVNDAGAYSVMDTIGIPSDIPVVSKMDTQDRLGKDRLGEDNPYMRNEEPNAQPNAQIKDAQDADTFEQFWCAYPKKKDKERARKAYAKVNVPIQVIVDAIEAQKKSDDWIKENGRFIPYPSSWLNGRRWEDEVNEKKDIRSVKTFENLTDEDLRF